MVSNWIVLIGSPAVGKTTLSCQLKEHLKANYYYSFDTEFPLESLKQSCLDSKNHRKLFLDKIKADKSEWIVIDDTCHLKSMQKRYLLVSEEGGEEIKLVFLYVSARNDQIPELKERNLQRDSHVTNEEIERITKHLNSSDFHWNNLIEYNFKKLPIIEDIVRDIQKILIDYKPRNLVEEVRVKDSESDANFFNQLNLALNKKISSTFKAKKRDLDGKQISIAKKCFLDEIRRNYDESDAIEELVLEFRNKYLLN